MEEQSPSDVTKRRETGIAQEVARDASLAAVSALVGIALGGIPGAVVGATVSPFLRGTMRFASEVFQRRKERLEAIVDGAIRGQGLSPEQALDHLEKHPQKADEFISLLQAAAASDPNTDAVLAAVIGELLVSSEETRRERILIVADSLRGLRSTHMRVLRKLHQSGGVCSASELATDIGIPEVELRGVVRELELKAMIKDVGKHPVEWRLRELGRAIMSFDRPVSAGVD